MKIIESLKRLFLFLFGKTKKQQFGSLLMTLALLGLIYIYLPLIQLYIPETPQEVNSESRIEITKIGVRAPIVWDVDPFNEDEYRNVLKSGVAHASGTSYPNASGTTYLFAHSSDMPWNLTRYNVIFFRLGELSSGDEISVWRDGHEFKYEVRDKKIVWPSEVEYLTKSVKTQLILQTCWPLGTAFQRLLIFADPL